MLIPDQEHITRAPVKAAVLIRGVIKAWVRSGAKQQKFRKAAHDIVLVTVFFVKESK